MAEWVQMEKRIWRRRIRGGGGRRAMQAREPDSRNEKERQLDTLRLLAARCRDWKMRTTRCAGQPGLLDTLFLLSCHPGGRAGVVVGKINTAAASQSIFSLVCDVPVLSCPV